MQCISTILISYNKTFHHNLSFTFTHLLLEFVQSGFYQLPTLRRRLATSSNFRHGLFLDARAGFAEKVQECRNQQSSSRESSFPIWTIQDRQDSIQTNKTQRGAPALRITIRKYFTKSTDFDVRFQNSCYEKPNLFVY